MKKAAVNQQDSDAEESDEDPVNDNIIEEEKQDIEGESETAKERTLLKLKESLVELLDSEESPNKAMKRLRPIPQR